MIEKSSVGSIECMFSEGTVNASCVFVSCTMLCAFLLTKLSSQFFPDSIEDVIRRSLIDQSV